MRNGCKDDIGLAVSIHIGSNRIYGPKAFQIMFCPGLAVPGRIFKPGDAIGIRRGEHIVIAVAVKISSMNCCRDVKTSFDVR